MIEGAEQEGPQLVQWGMRKAVWGSQLSREMGQDWGGREEGRRTLGKELSAGLVWKPQEPPPAQLGK